MRRGLHHRLRWLWLLFDSALLRGTLRLAWWSLLVAWLIFASLILALRYVVLPNVGIYHGQIEEAMSRAIGQPVTIGSIEARWQRLNPDLLLDNVVIFDHQGAHAFSLEQVEAVLSWNSLWRGQLTLALLAFERPVLHVRREASGRITVAGIDTEGESDPAFAEWVLDQKHIRIRNATVLWEDRLRSAPPLALEDLQFGLDNSGRRHRFGLSAAPPQNWQHALTFAAKSMAILARRLNACQGEFSYRWIMPISPAGGPGGLPCSPSAGAWRRPSVGRSG